MPGLELPIIKSNLSNIAYFLIKEQNFSLVFDNIVKICGDRLDYFNWLFFST